MSACCAATTFDAARCFLTRRCRCFLNIVFIRAIVVGIAVANTDD